MTRKWSESTFAPLYVLTSIISEKCLPSIRTWSIWDFESQPGVAMAVCMLKESAGVNTEGVLLQIVLDQFDQE